MIHLNPFAVSGILIASTCFVLVLILLKYGKSKLHRIWALFNFVVGLWGVGYILVGTSSSEFEALKGWRIAYSSIFISVIFYHTTSIFTGKKYNRLVFWGYTYETLFVLANYFFVGNKNFAIITEPFSSLYFVQSSSLIFNLCLQIWMFFAILGHIELIRYYKTAPVEARNKTLYFFWSMLIGFTGGSLNLLPIAGINVYPYGNFSIPLYCAIVAYAFLKHKLTDSNIIIRKGLVYSILTAIITIIYLIVILLFERLLQGLVGYNSFIVSIFAAMLIAIFFIPLRNKIQHIVDKIFFRGSQEEIVEENERLRQEIARSEKLKAVATLASGMAHEIKNPLTALRTFSEYLPQRLDDKEFLKKFSKIIGNEVGRIDGLVHQLLDFARPHPLELRKTDIHPLINNILDFLNSELIKHKIKVIKNFTANPVHLNIDPNQFKQALLNIFLNAIEAMSTGGTLTIETRNNAQNHFEIAIADTGIGIAKKDLPHIFDPFFSKKGGGTGLGLAITYGIIKEHTGKFKVDSTLGKGTEFVVELPV